MASSPMHMDDLEQAPARKGGKPPITASPAFPWIVALWFAALLGVGSLVVPVALMERASAATGLASILPMAAPPLGFTAQALVALVGTFVGGMLGLFLAKKIAAPKAGKPAARKPLNAAEDLDDDGIDGDAHDDLPSPPVSGRRRALAIEEEEGPSDFLNVAPLPGVSDRAGEPVTEMVDEPSEEPLEMSADMEEPMGDEPDIEEPRQVFQPGPVEAEEEPLDLEEDAALTDEQPELEHITAEEPAQRQEFQAIATASTPVIEVEYVEPVVATATAKQPLPFSPPSMAREDGGAISGDAGIDSEETFPPEADAGPESEETVSDKQIFDAPDAPASDDLENPAEEQQAFEPVADDAQDVGEEAGEGLVQLVQRLGSTLEKHREWSAEKAALKVAVAPVAEKEPEAEASDAEARIPEEFDPAAAEDAAQAMAAYFGSPAAAPVATEEEETAETVDIHQAPSFAAPAEDDPEPRQRYESFRGTIAAVELDDEGDEEDEIADLAASFTLPLAKNAEAGAEPAPRPAFDQPPPSHNPQFAELPSEAHSVSADEDEGEDEFERGSDAVDFASLNPFKRNADEFVRIEEPEPAAGDVEPAVLFPNQGARQVAAPAARAFDPPAGEEGVAAQRAERPRPSNDDNERALREALMNLQRMGK